MAGKILEWQHELADVTNEIDNNDKVMTHMLESMTDIDDDGIEEFTTEQEAQYEGIEARQEQLKERKAKLESNIQREKEIEKTRDLVANTLKSGVVGREGEREEGRVYAKAKPPREYFFSNLGEQLQAVARMSQGMATEKEVNWLRALNAAAIGAGESIGADGGFLVQQDFASEIFQKMHDMGSIISRVRTVGVAGNGLVIPGVNETSRATGSRWGGVQGYWIGEGDSPTASRPKFNRIELTLKKLGAVGYATDELLQDTNAMSEIFTQAFSEELTWFAENAIVNGSGAGEPLGIIDSNGPRVEVSKETGQPATTVVYENIINMWARMWARSRPNAVWLINQDIEPQLYTMSLPVGTGGAPVYLPAGGASASPFGTLMGRPVLPVEYCQTLGTAGDIILADFSQYMLIDKNGVQQDSSMHVRFLQNEMTFRAIYRVDGKPLWNSALTPANGTNTQSPFVTVATRS